MQPNTLAPLSAAPLPPKPGERGAQLTVLIDAAPLNPSSVKLRAWDRAFLLDSLSSLLRQLSYSSVEVVAFNLEQRHEIFRRENFAQPDMRSLAHALHTLDLAAISYDKLEHKRGWAEMLLGLLKQEAESKQPPDAVVFIGPKLRLEEKVPSDLLASYQKQMAPPLCVAYYPQVGADFPDSIQQLTLALKGKVFRIHSPDELARNLGKLQREINGNMAARSTHALQ
jgi:hypothetical protein